MHYFKGIRVETVGTVQIAFPLPLKKTGLERDRPFCMYERSLDCDLLCIQFVLSGIRLLIKPVLGA